MCEPGLSSKTREKRRVSFGGCGCGVGEMLAVNCGLSCDERALGRLGRLPGAKFSAFRSQVLVSTGVPSLDAVLGGGLPLGSILLLEEEGQTLSRVLMRCWYGEGVASEQRVLAVGVEAAELARNLPSPTTAEEEEERRGSRGPEDMVIAWRYQATPQVSSGPGSSTALIGHHLDLSQPLPAHLVTRHLTSLHQVGEGVLAALRGALAAPDLAGDGPTALLRLGLQDVSCAAWGTNPAAPAALLARLRLLIRAKPAAAVVSIDTALSDGRTVGCCRQQADVVLRLESLANHTSPLYAEYAGLLHLVKLATPNALAPAPTAAASLLTDWALKLRRKKILVEKLHLPPGLDTGSGSTPPTRLGCASTSSTPSAPSLQTTELF